MDVFLADIDLRILDWLRAMILQLWPQSTVHFVENTRFITEEVFQRKCDLVLISESLAFSDGVDRIGGIRSVSDVAVIAYLNHPEDLQVSRLLDAGADAVLQMPASSIILASQIRAVLRRSNDEAIDPDREIFTCGEISIDFFRRRVWVGEKQVALTPIEYRLLYLLAKNAGRTMPHRVLIDRTWGSGAVATPDHLKVNFSRIRSKLGNGDIGFVIESVRGVGYRLFDTRMAAIG